MTTTPRLWEPTDPTLGDTPLQWYVNTKTDNRVYGNTAGFLSDHIHLYTLMGLDTGYNLDRDSGAMKEDGSLVGDLLDLTGAIASIVIPGLGGAVVKTVALAGAALLLTKKGNLSLVVVYPPLPKAA
jgi:hypothetical protein